MKGIVLSQLLPFHSGSIKCVLSEDRIMNGTECRLRDIGFTEGAEVVRLFAAPCGDPVAYLVRGAIVAVRNSDAERILLLSEGRRLWD